MDGSNQPGPDLPMALGGHAIVKWNESFVMIIGGSSTPPHDGSKSSHYYDIGSDPDLTKLTSTCKFVAHFCYVAH